MQALNKYDIKIFGDCGGCENSWLQKNIWTRFSVVHVATCPILAKQWLNKCEIWNGYVYIVKCPKCVEPLCLEAGGGLCEVIVCDIWTEQCSSAIYLYHNPVTVSSVAKYFTMDGMFKIRKVFK